tara:strand:+ start:629 stop:748 length:120 start_codon:yes stop_codon:yes gene_type:complete
MDLLLQKQAIADQKTHALEDQASETDDFPIYSNSDSDDY